MKNSFFVELYTKHENFSKITSDIFNKQKIWIKGLTKSAISIFYAAIYNKTNTVLFYIAENKTEAAYIYNDLQTLLPGQKILYYPSSYKIKHAKTDYKNIDSSGLILRTEALNAISQNKKCIIISYPVAIAEMVVSNKQLKLNTLEITVADKLTNEFIVEVLQAYNFKPVDFVYEPGQYATRGSILDIFSFSNDYPFRIDFFGNEIESIRTFDIISQLSVTNQTKIEIIPNLHTKNNTDTQISIFEFADKNSIFIVYDIAHALTQIANIQNIINSDPENITSNHLNNYITHEQAFKQISDFCTIDNGLQPTFSSSNTYTFNLQPQPHFQKNFANLKEFIYNLNQQGFTIYVCSEKEKQLLRISEILKSELTHMLCDYVPCNFILHGGFIDNSLKIVCLTDHEIFERYHNFKINDSAQTASKEIQILSELNDLKPGDYIVHSDHGIGRFGGLETIDIKGKKQEVIRLVYQDNDILYVSLQALHRLSKYKGQEGVAPKMYKLGSGTWQKLKLKTKSKVKDIARDLIKLYALRKQQTGFAYSPDTSLQHELEASFIYEDTPDQEKATTNVKADMELQIPMDRLVCGDVGFGKTEIAIRAAFKAVTDSKQVAVLVPTTILALQHYKTFKERLKNFPVTVDHLSRLRTAAEQKLIVQNIKNGKIDIVIGTHRIVSNDIDFKDLGLLIIDEEQKFGVGLKEKLKQLKLNVDTLTLTATPIPRTLQFSLLGARDLSIINTPPPNRYPIVTETHTFNHEIITEAIEFELNRNGQVFFIHNRVQNIEEIKKLINKLVPSAKAITAHGQMEPKKLEKIILDFVNEDYNVLISTTIIESGLDIPNANTIIINEASNFGLSDLHQLRGRVGRSNKKAFCYLLTQPPSTLPQHARQRLKAIETFSELGSGFNIALQDLDIRGAGNLLGAEQSGFIADIGIETYQRILEEAIIELRETEYQHILIENEQPDNQSDTNENKYVTDCTVDTDLEVRFPDTFIENITERFKLYRKLDNLSTEAEIKEFEQQITDRFGPIPPQSSELINIVRLRQIAIQLGIEKIILKSNKMIINTVSKPDSRYYQSAVFTKILQHVQKYHRKIRMKEADKKIIITIENIDNVTNALAELNRI